MVGGEASMNVKISRMIRNMVSVPSGRIGLYLHVGVILMCIIFKLCPDMLFDSAIRFDDFLAALLRIHGAKLWDFGFLGLGFLVTAMVGAGFFSYGIAIRSFKKHTS
jgi:hypothetical protein